MSLDYHLGELAIALDPSRPEHLMPPFGAADQRVLDVGCGAGQTLVAGGFAAERAASGSWGVDVDLEALQAGRLRWPALRLAAARGEALPFADASFDLVFSRVALPYMRIPEALAECHRVLRPGGTLWLALHPLAMTLRELRAAVRQRAWKNALYRVYVLGNGAVFQASGRTLAVPGVGRTESWQGARGMRLALRRSGFVDVALTRRAAILVQARRPSVA